MIDAGFQQMQKCDVFQICLRWVTKPRLVTRCRIVTCSSPASPRQASFSYSLYMNLQAMEAKKKFSLERDASSYLNDDSNHLQAQAQVRTSFIMIADVAAVYSPTRSYSIMMKAGTISLSFRPESFLSPSQYSLRAYQITVALDV